MPEEIISKLDPDWLEALINEHCLKCYSMHLSAKAPRHCPNNVFELKSFFDAGADWPDDEVYSLGIQGSVIYRWTYYRRSGDPMAQVMQRDSCYDRIPKEDL